MRALPVLVVLTLLTLGFAVPAAEATGCLVGNTTTCFVGLESRVCVTEPCDELDVCVNYGAICLI